MIRGHIDRLDADTCAGWIIDLDQPSVPVGIKVFINGVLRYNERAELTRSDLAAAFGHQEHGFSFGISTLLVPGENIIDIKVEGSDFRFDALPARVDTRTTSEFVEIGHDGWLFLKNDTNDSVALLEGRKPLEPADLLNLKCTLLRRQAILDAMNIRHAHYIIPDKGVIYNDKRKQPLRLSPTRPAVQLADAVGREFLRYPVNSFRALTHSFEIFLKNDTHIAPQSYLVVFGDIISAVGDSVDFDFMDAETVRVDGDLGNKIQTDPLDLTIVRPSYATDYLHDEVTPSVDSGSRIRKALIHHVNGRARNRSRCLVVGTSSAYYVREFFFAQYRDVYFYWENGLDDEFVRQIKPDLVFFIMAERFIGPELADNMFRISYRPPADVLTATAADR